jgi:hypothetical protein
LLNWRGIQITRKRKRRGHEKQTQRRIVMTNVRALTVTGAVMAAVTYVICAAFVALAPDAASTLGTYVTHMDLTRVGRTVTWGGAFIGFAFFTAFVALVCGASASIYNRLARD